MVRTVAENVRLRGSSKTGEVRKLALYSYSAANAPFADTKNTLVLLIFTILIQKRRNLH